MKDRKIVDRKMGMGSFFDEEFFELKSGRLLASYKMEMVSERQRDKLKAEF